MPEQPPEPAPVEATSAPSETREDWETRFKYLLADFENFRRRSTKERETATRQARGAMLRELLPLIEAFRSASTSVGDRPTTDPLRRGFELLDREWATFLKREGVEPVAAVGQPFQAEEAEAVGEAPADAKVPDGSVQEIVQQGYRFFGGLLRPAKVIVARARSVPPGPGAEPTERPAEPEAES